MQKTRLLMFRPRHGGSIEPAWCDMNGWLCADLRKGNQMKVKELVLNATKVLYTMKAFAKVNALYQSSFLLNMLSQGQPVHRRCRLVASATNGMFKFCRRICWNIMSPCSEFDHLASHFTVLFRESAAGSPTLAYAGMVEARQWETLGVP